MNRQKTLRQAVSAVWQARMIWQARGSIRLVLSAAVESLVDEAAGRVRPEFADQLERELIGSWGLRREVVYSGVCGDESGPSGSVGCGELFELGYEAVTVVRWKGARRGREWQVRGECPRCGAPAVNRFLDGRAARALVADGAGEIVVDRPGEIGEDVRLRGRPCLTVADVRAARGLLDDDVRFDWAVAKLAGRYRP